MNLIRLLGIVLINALILTGCASQSPYQTKAQNDLLTETWLNHVNLDAHRWIEHADKWFLTGEPNHIERCNQKAPIDKAISMLSVRVPNFEKVIVNGTFQVQIVGRQERNAVFVFGPQVLIRQVAVDIRNHSLYVHQINHDGEQEPVSLKKVIVRIGIRQLRGLTNKGSGDVYGRYISSDQLAIYSKGDGNIMLAGDMNLYHINQTGNGTVTVIGAQAPKLNLNLTSNGNINLSGRIGIQTIKHSGDGDINIIGADSGSLSLFTSGSGTNTLAGKANLKQIIATENSRVYLYWINSQNPSIYVRDHARVGLAGRTDSVTIDTQDAGRYDGQYLQSQNAYVRSRNSSHVNVSATNRMMLQASGSSSIYYFGSPAGLSPFIEGDGLIIPIEYTKPLSMPKPQPLAWNKPPY